MYILSKPTQLEEMIFKMYSEGKSQRQIAKELNRSQPQISRCLNNYLYKFNNNNPDKKINVFRFYRYKKALPGAQDVKRVVIESTKDKIEHA